MQKYSQKQFTQDCVLKMVNDFGIAHLDTYKSNKTTFVDKMCSKERDIDDSRHSSDYMKAHDLMGANNISLSPVKQMDESVYSSHSLDCVNCSQSSTHQARADFKVECVYSLLSMLGSSDSAEMSKKLLDLSRAPETCKELRRSGCMPLLVQMVYSDAEENASKCYIMALHNVINNHPNEKSRRQEIKILRLLEQLMSYSIFLKSLLQSGGEAIADYSDRHPLAAMSSLMKISFDEEHRCSMVELGALHAIPTIIHLDYAVHGPKPSDPCCGTLRRYALMALTNLTFGDENSKAVLCGQKLFMAALVAQLNYAPDDLLQVSASVLRNLSWRANNSMKIVLNEIGTVTALAQSAMVNKNENTLKAILSALWNLSAHCSMNKAEFCAVNGALAFLVDMLSFESSSKTLKIIENAGGILRNVSSHIAVQEKYREILRARNCLSILLQHLKSESLTVVSNSCGTLWNLSARCPIDQKYLWDNGAIPMLRSLIHSKHAMISEGSSSALKNLLNFRPTIQNNNTLDAVARSMHLKELPTLEVRKQRAFKQELRIKDHAETSDNMNIISDTSNQYSEDYIDNLHAPLRITLFKSKSRDSIFSVKSDSIYEKSKRSNSAVYSVRCSSSKSNSVSLVHIPHLKKSDQDEENQKRAGCLPKTYFAKYENEVSAVSPEKSRENTNYTSYQETDLDQLTDFSLRYAENQTELETEAVSSNKMSTNMKDLTGNGHKKHENKSAEIISIIEDSVKCYQTEDTPYVISSAASISDLTNSKTDNGAMSSEKTESMPRIKCQKTANKTKTATNALGCYTPDNPINYCEEGTPGYFSRYESLSSLDDALSQAGSVMNSSKKAKPFIADNARSMTEFLQEAPKSVVYVKKTELNSAQETPLMFSRHSSMDSLKEEGIGICDDASSVVSECSRLASGLISPSEIPDSPTQISHSPHKNVNNSRFRAITPKSPPNNIINGDEMHHLKPNQQHPLHSVFEDNLSSFNVENTPAQFSSTTSLSNLSILDEKDVLPSALQFTIIEDKDNRFLESYDLSEGEEEENHANRDDFLLANCINIGMNRSKAVKPITTHLQLTKDEITQYFTEDTPALLSKQGSNTDLSTISTSLNYNEKAKVEEFIDQSRNAISIAIDVDEKPPFESASILKQRLIGVRESIDKDYHTISSNENKHYTAESSACNFDLLTDVSKLTTDFEHEAEHLSKYDSGASTYNNKNKSTTNISKDRSWLHDSLSSLSIDSEDDTNLLSQAIAAGYNRPHSNLGFVTPTLNASLGSEPIDGYAMHTTNERNSRREKINNECNSSLESSDSNDNHSSSLLELCILSGMHKKRQKQLRRGENVIASFSNPNLMKSNGPTVQDSKKKSKSLKHRQRKDEEILQECIYSGIAKRSSSTENTLKRNKKKPTF